jgi:hypothetical protein
MHCEFWDLRGHEMEKLLSAIAGREFAICNIGLQELLMRVWEPPTLNQALANQSGPRQLQPSLVRAL